MKILFLTNIPSPYRVDFFNELGKHCELTVLFEKSASQERDSSWGKQEFVNFTGIILKGRETGVDQALCFRVTKYIKKNEYDNIIVTNIATPTGMLAIQHMKMKRISYIIEGDGGFAKTGKGFKEGVKRYFIRNAKAYLSTSKMHDEYYMKYGANRDKIYRYPFTSLKNEDMLKKVVTKEEKQKLRKQLRMKENKIIVSVGQFIYRKGYDILLNACIDINKDIGVYLIGGKPTDFYLKMKKEYKLENVHFIDFKSKNKLQEYYKASDLFALPTRQDIWGLVVNEAMANGLPIITTDRCNAGLELVKDDENGYIIVVEDVEKLTQKINYILENDVLCENMAKKSLEKIRPYTIQNMATRHIELLKGALN